MVQLDEKAAQISANIDDLRMSVDDNHTKFEKRHEETSIKASKSKKTNIRLITVMQTR